MFGIEKQIWARIASMVAMLMISHPLSAWGTIGIAETHSQLRYNQYATLSWIHPGDGCDSGKYCFHIRNSGDKYHRFKGLTCSLQKINVPTGKSNPLIFAQCCLDKQWLVYDLRTEKYLIRTDNYAAALNVWKSDGSKEPDFADAQDGAKGLYRTWSSRFENWIWMALLFLPLIVVVGMPLFTFLTVRFAMKFRNTRQSKHLVVVYLFSDPGFVIMVRGDSFRWFFLRISVNNMKR